MIIKVAKLFSNPFKSATPEEILKAIAISVPAASALTGGVAGYHIGKRVKKHDNQNSK